MFSRPLLRPTAYRVPCRDPLQAYARGPSIIILAALFLSILNFHPRALGFRPTVLSSHSSWFFCLVWLTVVRFFAAMKLNFVLRRYWSMASLHARIVRDGPGSVRLRLYVPDSPDRGSSSSARAEPEPVASLAGAEACCSHHVDPVSHAAGQFMNKPRC